jgi:hypothetical protein
MAGNGDGEWCGVGCVAIPIPLALVSGLLSARFLGCGWESGEGWRVVRESRGGATRPYAIGMAHRFMPARDSMPR